ncbi:hypothetical protein KEM60_01360 [Austwickia sp. TVS 96-490-7B]|uniref:hypothetical protein n=1 Tax=Austwickia sp. TVS 96-490-7B TaxID=2830843 RepID=UPI001C571FA1|nr:hypothetical protein [Austwickia sp. TVS 96-490-7B]MBW3085163.1 hypothetical protein [Austwickia sp. TVS 96-490-7B]
MKHRPPIFATAVTALCLALTGCSSTAEGTLPGADSADTGKSSSTKPSADNTGAAQKTGNPANPRELLEAAISNAKKASSVKVSQYDKDGSYATATGKLDSSNFETTVRISGSYSFKIMKVDDTTWLQPRDDKTIDELGLPKAALFKYVELKKSAANKFNENSPQNFLNKSLDMLEKAKDIPIEDATKVETMGDPSKSYWRVMIKSNSKYALVRISADGKNNLLAVSGFSDSQFDFEKWDSITSISGPEGQDKLSA